MEEYLFCAPVMQLGVGFTIWGVPLPEDVAAALAGAGVRRVVGTIGGIAVSRAIMNPRRPQPYLTLNRDLMRRLRVGEGDLLDVMITADPAPDDVALCDEFEAVLEQHAHAAACWEAMTPGRRRSYAHYVNGGKRPETRLKRALDLAQRMEEGRL